jgi:replicative DNA helicase
MTSASSHLQVAPHSREAEEALLGSILINPNLLAEITLFLNPGDFFLVQHQWIWEAMLRVHQRGAKIDVLTLAEELRAQQRLSEVGGPSYLTYLLGGTLSSTFAETYGQIVARMALRRRLMVAADEIVKLARQEDVEINEVIAKAENALLSVTEKNTRRELVPISQAISEYVERLEYLHTHPEERIGIPTGFRQMDDLLGGFHRGDLLILAARPGMGKTSLMLNIALRAAKSKARVAVFSLEMDNDQLIQRLVSTETNINSQKLRLLDLQGHEWQRFNEGAQKLSALPIHLDDTPALSVAQLRTKCRRLLREQGLDLVIVDYLQLMSGGTFQDNRVQEISAISRGLKELARELHVPILAGSQLSRAVEQRGDKRPILSDLRESGSIEQDADIVMFIYRDDVYNEASERPNIADILILKHRNGPTGTFSLFFQKEQTAFTELQTSKVSLGDV